MFRRNRILHSHRKLLQDIRTRRFGLFSIRTGHFSLSRFGKGGPERASPDYRLVSFPGALLNMLSFPETAVKDPRITLIMLMPWSLPVSQSAPIDSNRSRFYSPP
jgi:hypothetical protein